MKIGLMLPQAAADGAGGTWPDILGLARQAEGGGADSVWLSDHFFHREDGAAIGSETGYHEGWTLLSALAATTERVELGTLVLATSFRPAGLLAKMAVTADEVSGGRLILGLGCGWHEPEYEAFGYPFDHRVSRFEEALAIIAPLVRGERVTAGGVYQAVRDAAILPPPARQMPILVAAKGPRMLELTVRHADAWQTAWFGQPDDRFRDRLAGIHAACEAAGRDPATLDVTVGIELSDPPEEGSATLPTDRPAIVDALEAWEAAGADHLQLGVWPATPQTFDVVLGAIRAFRGAARGSDPRPRSPATVSPDAGGDVASVPRPRPRRPDAVRPGSA
jgi:luciferase-like monooxygenase